MCLVSPVQGQTTAATPQQAECVGPINFPILDAASGTFYYGDFKLCGGKVNDLTSGANALVPGQKLFLVPGRTLSGKWKVGALVRAFPNRAYPIHPGDPRVQDGATLWWRVTPATSWENVPAILPFIPKTVGKVGHHNVGEDIYGYSDLTPLPGYQDAMAPLNSQSVIIGVAGLSFADETGLQAFLGGLAPAASWVEILYVQRDEPRVQIRRAFIPLMPRANAAANWATLARQNPMAKPNNRSTVASFAVVGLAIAAMAAGNNLAHGQRNCHWEHVTEGDGINRSFEKCD